MSDWTAFLVYEFPQTTLYALFFLLGSQAVSGLSDIRRMSAQREFMEVWILFAVVVFGLDAWRVFDRGAALDVNAVKWVLVVIVGVLSSQHVGVLFRLARGDVWAIVAVASLFNPLFIVLYVVLLKVADLILRPLLRNAFGSGGAYPFIPVVLAATLATVALIFFNVVDTVLDATGAL